MSSVSFAQKSKNTVTVTATVTVNNSMELSIVDQPLQPTSADVSDNMSLLIQEDSNPTVVFKGRAFSKLNLVINAQQVGSITTSRSGIASIPLDENASGRVDVLLEY